MYLPAKNDRSATAFSLCDSFGFEFGCCSRFGVVPVALFPLREASLFMFAAAFFGVVSVASEHALIHRRRTRVL